MLQKTKSKLVLAAGPAILAVTVFNMGAVYADCSDSQATDTNGITNGAKCVANGSGLKTGQLTANIQTIVNIMLYALGIGAVIMLIVGGFQYIFSTGNSEKAGKARGTIINALIGLIFALLAFVIVNFVISKFG